MFAACNFFGQLGVYISNSTLMTTWGSRWLKETWVTCFLLPFCSSCFLLPLLRFRHMLSAAMDGWNCGIPALVASGHIVSYPRTPRRPMYIQNHSRKPLYGSSCRNLPLSKIVSMDDLPGAVGENLVAAPGVRNGHAYAAHSFLGAIS
jgi:hypothetical protein